MGGFLQLSLQQGLGMQLLGAGCGSTQFYAESVALCATLTTRIILSLIGHDHATH